MYLRLAVVLVLLAVTIGLAYGWHRREGRFVEAEGRMDRADLGFGRRERPSATIVEFFGQGCAPCVTVQQRLERIAEQLPDVAIVKIDAGERLDVAERYEVRRVPTLFVLDESLRVIWRASGVPTEDAIRAALLGPDWAGRPHPEDARAENRA